MKEGMVFTIEPMINAGKWQCDILSDDWTAVTIDQKLSAQFEHMIYVGSNGAEILTNGQPFYQAQLKS
jgi:methionyl aminopeptidase